MSGHDHADILPRDNCEFRVCLLNAQMTLLKTCFGCHKDHKTWYKNALSCLLYFGQVEVAFESQRAAGKQSFMCRALRYAAQFCLGQIMLIACEEIEILCPFRDHPSFSELSIWAVLTWKLRKVRSLSVIVCDCQVMKGAGAHYLITRGLSAHLIGQRELCIAPCNQANAQEVLAHGVFAIPS